MCGPVACDIIRCDCVDEIVRIDADALAHGGQGQRDSADLVGRVQALNTIRNDEGGFAKHGD